MIAEKDYLCLKKVDRLIHVSHHLGTNIRILSTELSTPYRNIYRTDYLKSVQKYMILSNQFGMYIEWKNDIMVSVNKSTGKALPILNFSELKTIINKYEKGIKT